MNVALAIGNVLRQHATACATCGKLQGSFFGHPRQQHTMAEVVSHSTRAQPRHARMASPQWRANLIEGHRAGKNGPTDF